MTHRRDAEDAEGKLFSLAGERPAREKYRLHEKALGMDINELSNRIIGAAIEVHKTLGPGLLGLLLNFMWQ